MTFLKIAAAIKIHIMNNLAKKEFSTDSIATNLINGNTLGAWKDRERGKINVRKKMKIAGELKQCSGAALNDRGRPRASEQAEVQEK